MPIFQKYDQLRLLVAHLGLPARTSAPLSAHAARQKLAAVRALAAYPSTLVKLSGFYALTEPGYGYPHRAAWPYVQALLQDFGPHRLLWGSDFPPCMDTVSFPQTLGVLDEMPFLSQNDRQGIEGGNLLAILQQT